MPGTTFDIKTEKGSKFTGYLALPEAGPQAADASSKRPGILLIQEIFGVNSHIREVADLYALAGYVVLAPDMFWRVQPHVELGYAESDIKDARDIANKCDKELMVQDLIDAAKVMRDLPQCSRKIGTVGYCMGGYLAYRLAVSDAVDCAVGYYGGMIDQHLDKASSLHCPLMLHFGEKDGHIPLSSVEKIEAALKDHGHVEVYVYKGAEHGFNCDQRSSYNRQSAMLAYGRSAILLNKSLT